MQYTVQYNTMQTDVTLITQLSRNYQQYDQCTERKRRKKEKKKKKEKKRREKIREKNMNDGADRLYLHSVIRRLIRLH